MTDPAAIDAYLRRKKSPLAGLGAKFVEVGNKYGIDPNLLVAISGAESAFGRNIKAGTNNPFGWGPHIQFPSFAAGIERVGRGLKSGYFNQGLNTPEKISRKWAPVGASNDPTGLNRNWAGNVNQFLGELGGQKFKVSPSAPGATVGPGTRRGAPAAGVDKQALTNAILAGGELDLGAILKAKPVGVSIGPIPVAKDFTGKIGKNAAPIVAAAKEFLGTPYSWGGGTTKGPSRGFGRGANTVGFDCSSFIQFLEAKRGVQIPRVTYDQWKTGAPVKLGQLRAGDQVFFRMGPRGPEHTGLYIGNGQFIHAPKTGDVIKISKLSGYYRQQFVGARRHG